MKETASLGNNPGVDVLSLIILPLRIMNWNQVFAKFRETLFYYVRQRRESKINVHK